MLEVIPYAAPLFSIVSYVIRERASRECFIVDPHPGLERAIGHDLTIKAVINTHIHYDHILGNPAFKDKAPIWAHRKERRLAYYAVNTLFSALSSRRIPGHIDFRLLEGDILTLGGDRISVLHTPGHSPGSICLAWPGNLIAGDTVFVGGIGRTDLPLGSSSEMKRSIRRLMDLPDDTLVWPGHNYAGRFPVEMRANRRALASALNAL